MTTLQHYIRIVEAAYAGGSTYWYNPATQEVVPASDHGEAVKDNPSTFGIDWRVESEMETAFSPPATDEDDEEWYEEEDRSCETSEMPEEFRGWNGPGSIWHENDAWEQLAMNRGWVRVGEAIPRVSATYVSGSTGKAVWYTVKRIADGGRIGDKLEIEISSHAFSAFVYLDLESIEAFLRTGPNRADAFIAKLSR